MANGEDTRDHPNRRPVVPMRGIIPMVPSTRTSAEWGTALAQGLQSAVNRYGTKGVDPASGLADSSHVVEGIGTALDRAGFKRVTEYTKMHPAKAASIRESGSLMDTAKAVRTKFASTPPEKYKG